MEKRRKLKSSSFYKRKVQKTVSATNLLNIYKQGICVCAWSMYWGNLFDQGCISNVKNVFLILVGVLMAYNPFVELFGGRAVQD